MKRALILCLFIFSGTTAGFAATTFFPPLQPLQPIGANPLMQQNNNYNNITSLPDPFVKHQNANYPDITKIEQTLFGNTYPTQDITIRLSRIERSMFSSTYPNASIDQRIQNVIMNFNQINKYPNISQNTLSRMESKILHQQFPQNSAQRRIERLEEQIFGAAQSGDLDTRYNNLLTASKNYNNITQPVAVPNTGWRSVIQNLGGGLGRGYVTGYTPPLSPYYGNSFPNNYGYNNYGMNPYGIGLGFGGRGMYRGVRTNTGMYDGFQDFGSTTGVNILD